MVAASNKGSREDALSLDGKTFPVVDEAILVSLRLAAIEHVYYLTILDLQVYKLPNLNPADYEISKVVPALVCVGIL